jgi:hypothetical protein
MYVTASDESSNVLLHTVDAPVVPGPSPVLDCPA